MTTPPTGMFMHLGGPCDGVEMPVEVDADGVPVEIYTIPGFTNPSEAVPGFAAHQAKGLKSMYEREETLADDGFTYVFHFRGTEEIDYNRLHRAA